MWEVEALDEFRDWYRSLTEEQAVAVTQRVDQLDDVGPALDRPTVDHIEGSRHHNMKELRCSKDGALRVLFIFDPLRQAVLLLGGNKATEGWNDWYRWAIPRADDLYDGYLKDLEDEGLI